MLSLKVQCNHFMMTVVICEIVGSLQDMGNLSTVGKRSITAVSTVPVILCLLCLHDAFRYLLCSKV